MNVNVDKCGIMHMRKKGVKRSGQKCVMNGEVDSRYCDFYS